MQTHVAQITSAITQPAATSPHLVPELISRGDSIYFGHVFARRDTAQEPVFVYERRVTEHGPDVASTHMTREPSGAIVLAETALHAPDYALREYTLHADQLGQSGTIRVGANRLYFERRRSSGVRKREERLSDPVVVGPTLVGYIARNLERLRAKQVLRVRMALLDRLRTFAFELHALDAGERTGQIRVQMRPVSFLIALAVAPVDFYFENSSRKLVRLEGPVPPKRRTGRGWKNFEARVEYQYVADTYR